MTREEAHNACLSRDCSCIQGKDRDFNYHEVINTLCTSHEKEVAKLQQQVSYWKLSFNKQVQASRGELK